jgi:Protein of unknown function (DUF2510)
MDLSRPGGWYPDPSDPRMLRYWDGHAWTGQVGQPPAAGWYRDPADEHSVRYWGGTAWTASTAAAPAAAAATALATAAIPTGTTAVAAPPMPTATTTFAAPPLPTAMTTVAAPPMPAVTPAVAAPPVALPSETPSSLIEAPPPPAPSAFASRAAAARLHATPPAAVADAPSGPPRAEPEPKARVEPKRRRGAAIVLLVAVVLLALAIGGYIVVSKWSIGPAGVLDSSGTPSVSAPAGYHLVLLHSANVTFAIRDSWLALDPSSSAIKQAEQRVAAANPQLASTLTDFGTAASNVKFLAVDVGNRIYGSNVEIVSLGIAKSALSDPAGAQAAFRKQIPDAVVSPTTIAGTRALLVAGTINLTLPTGGQLAVHATGYVVGTSAGVFSIMFGTTDAGSQDPDVQTAVRTLRLTAYGG